MRKSGGREASRSQQGVLPAGIAISSSTLDETDVEILSLMRNRPMTILNVAERMDMPFVECLLRARKLWRLELLERVDAEPEEIGLHRYMLKGRV